MDPMEEPSGVDGQAAGEEQPPPERFKFILGKSKGKRPERASTGGGAESGASARELISALEGSDVVAADGKVSTQGGPKVIPGLENTWKPREKVAGSGRASALDGVLHEVEDADRFEEAAEDGAQDGGVQYGLSVRQRPEGSGAREGAAAPRLSLRDMEAQKLREDLGKLPEQASLEAYETMPIESFGEALLRGLGWKQGQGIGRNGKGAAEAVEYVARPTRLGLGATPKEKKEPERRYIKPGETRGGKKDLVAPAGPDGRVRHVKGVSEKLVERDTGALKEGKLVVITAGRHQGLEARVLAAIPGKEAQGVKKFSVRLVRSEEDVQVWEDEMKDKRKWEEDRAQEEARRRALASAQKAEQDEQRPAKRPREARPAENGGEAHGEEGRRPSEGAPAPVQRARPSGQNGRGSRVPDMADGGRDRRGGSNREAEGRDSSQKAPGRGWLMPHIRVRIVSRERASGKLYLSKGTILDVVTPTRCDVLLDGGSGKLLEDVAASELETALPKRDGRVAVLRGVHRGERGKLLERSSQREEAVVQLAQTFEIVRLPLDDVAEFVGEEGAYEG